VRQGSGRRLVGARHSPSKPLQPTYTYPDLVGSFVKMKENEKHDKASVRAARGAGESNESTDPRQQNRVVTRAKSTGKKDEDIKIIPNEMDFKKCHGEKNKNCHYCEHAPKRCASVACDICDQIFCGNCCKRHLGKSEVRILVAFFPPCGWPEFTCQGLIHFLQDCISTYTRLPFKAAYRLLSARVRHCTLCDLSNRYEGIPVSLCSSFSSLFIFGFMRSWTRTADGLAPYAACYAAAPRSSAPKTTYIANDTGGALSKSSEKRLSVPFSTRSLAACVRCL
jgi:hypothetical protein